MRFNDPAAPTRTARDLQALEVATVLLGSPERPLSLDGPGVASLRAALAEALASRPRALVLRSAHPEVFCAGLDVGAALAAGPDGARAVVQAGVELLVGLRRLAVPTIALIDGVAAGGGLGLAAACDLVVAGPRAALSLPELRYGLIPAIVLPLLRERARPAALRRLALIGDALDGRRALGLGLVDAAVDDPSLVDAALVKLVRSLRRAHPEAVARLRAACTEGGLDGLAAALRAGAEQTLADLGRPEVAQAQAALADGELPAWARKPEPVREGP